MVNNAEFISKIAPPLADELLVAQKLVADHLEGVRRKGFSMNDSTSAYDYLLLYALVRRFGCKSAFEIGTYIGATAVSINSAARRNGGVFTTCDPVDFNVLPPWDGIRFIHAKSNIALEILHEEGRSLDFLFIDWVPDSRSLELISRMCDGNTIVAVHDYTPADPKGAAVVEVLTPEFGGARPGIWITPDSKPCDIGRGLQLNQCTAFFVPNQMFNMVP